MADSLLDIIVVGGGIGGLFAAKAMTARGLRVSVYEQAPALGEVGAGVFVTPNSMRHLQRVGLGPEVERRGARVGFKSEYFRHNGTAIAPVQVTDSSGWNATYGMHRADFVSLLAAALPAESVISDTAALDSSKRPIGPVSRSRTAPLSVLTSSLQRTGFTQHCGRTLRQSLSLSSRDQSPIAGWCHMRAFRSGRPMPGRCGWATASIF
jgi:hypothetical protein